MNLAPDAQRALVRAQEIAHAVGAEEIGSLHLLAGLLAIDDRLADAGLTADAVREYLEAGAVPPPPPMTPEEAAELLSELRRRGVALAQAEGFVERLQRRRALGPVELDAHARRAVETGATKVLSEEQEPGDVRRLLTTLFASPAPEIARLLLELRVDAEAIREALGQTEL